MNLDSLESDKISGQYAVTQITIETTLIPVKFKNMIKPTPNHSNPIGELI